MTACGPLLDVLISQVVEAFAFWQILADQPVCVFVPPSFPGMIGMSKETLGLQPIRHPLVIGEFLAVVIIGQSVNVGGIVVPWLW